MATGAAADAQYSSARRDARDHMRMRNAFFQQVRVPPRAAITLWVGDCGFQQTAKHITCLSYEFKQIRRLRAHFTHE